MKRLCMLAAVLLATSALSSELTQQSAVIVPAPSAGGVWLAVGPDGKTFVPDTLPDGSAILRQSCGLFWAAGPISMTTVNVGGVVPPSPAGPTAELTVTPEKIKPNGKVSVSWKAGGTAKSATLQGVMVALAGTQEFAPAATTEYVLTVADGPQTVTARKTVVVDGTGPQPPPNPQPGPAVSGLTLLGVRAPIWPANTPQSMIDVETAKHVRDYLSENCHKDKSGAASFRFVAPGADLSREKDQLWKDLLAIPTGDVKPPYWLIRSPVGQSIIAWPKDAAAAVAELQKVKGAK